MQYIVQVVHSSAVENLLTLTQKTLKRLRNSPVLYVVETGQPFWSSVFSHLREWFYQGGLRPSK